MRNVGTLEERMPRTSDRNTFKSHQQTGYAEAGISGMTVNPTRDSNNLRPSLDIGEQSHKSKDLFHRFVIKVSRRGIKGPGF